MPRQRIRKREDKRANEYLASERTFLAWIRTSIAVVALGFVIARFSVWLRELALRTGQPAPTGGGASLPIGLVMMGFGATMAILALWRYYAVNRAIERGEEMRPDRSLVLLLTALVVLLALTMIVYMLVTG